MGADCEGEIQDKADTVAELNWLCHPMWQAGRVVSRRGEGGLSLAVFKS